jgi:4-amino-4-deoxy-L-arabinose transferase-like glycosyltransferase
MRQRISETGNYKFLLAWLLIGFILLSVIPEKKERYMLPLEIPMSLMVSCLFYSIFQKFKTGSLETSDRWLMKVQGWLMVLLLAALPVIAFLTVKQDFFKAQYAVASGISAIAVIVLIRELIKMETVRSFNSVFVSAMLVVVLITIFYLPLVSYKIYNQDFRDVAAVKQRQEYYSAEFISAGELNMQLIWKIGKPVKPVSDLQHFHFKNQEKYFLFSYTPVETVLSAVQIEQNTITSLGAFDCNQEKGKCKIYVSIVGKKI